MIVNLNVLKEIHKNHKEETDIKLKTEERGLLQVCMYQKGYSESALQKKSHRAGENKVGMQLM